MRAVIQRVERAKVAVKDEIVGQIKGGLLVFLGIGDGDTVEDLKYIANKIMNLRIFPDLQGKMNLSVRDLSLEVLVVSQFTLYGDCRKGNRPSFTQASLPEMADTMYIQLVDLLKKQGVKVATGVFQAHMRIDSINDGPVTMIIDSKRIF